MLQDWQLIALAVGSIAFGGLSTVGVLVYCKSQADKNQGGDAYDIMGTGTTPQNRQTDDATSDSAYANLPDEDDGDASFNQW